MFERRQKNKLQALRVIPTKMLLKETTEVDKVLCKFKTHSITKANELFYAGAVVLTNSLRVKMNKEAEKGTHVEEGITK